MALYSSDRRSAADRYLAAELTILSLYYNVSPSLIAETDLRTDMTEATDLLLPNGTRIAKRVRQPHQIKFKDQIIFRHQPNAKHPTEWEKILSGSADVCLYSIAKDESQLACWHLINLDAIRAAEQRGWSCTTPPEHRIIGDDDGFIILRLDGFLSRPPLVLASSEGPPETTDDICGFCQRLVASIH